MSPDRLAIYLNDHLAGAVGAGELARRSAAANRGTPLGDTLAGLVAELEQDRQALESAMERLGAGVDRSKVAAAWVAEKLGRLKLNGSLLSYSPLSRLEELELLVLAVEGKALLWQALAKRDGPDSDLDFDALIKRARSQRRRLERRRLEAVADAL